MSNKLKVDQWEQDAPELRFVLHNKDAFFFPLLIICLKKKKSPLGGKSRISSKKNECNPFWNKAVTTSWEKGSVNTFVCCFFFLI